MLGVVLLALVLYLKTLYPTVAGGDSGELVAAAYLLGITPSIQFLSFFLSFFFFFFFFFFFSFSFSFFFFLLF